MFTQENIDLSLLKKRAFNLRWASQPEGVIPLTAADPDFPCAPEIAEAITRFSKDNYFSYVPAEGYSFFREAAAAYFSDIRSMQANPDFILPVDSAAFGIHAVCKAFLTKGDEAIIFDPVDFLFRHNIEAQGAVAVPYRISIDPTTGFDPERMEALISPKTRMICLCNPLNPSGKVFTKTELEKIGNLAVKYKLIILSDEIWSDIIFHPSIYTSIGSLSREIANQTIVVHGFSKSYGLAGLRIGLIMAFHEAHYKKLFDASGHASTVHGTNAIAQVAGTAALNECGYWLDAFLKHLESIRKITVDGLNGIPGFFCHPPQGCYLAFANITETGYSSEELYQLLLEDAKVAVVPGLGKWFGEGANGYIRISFASSEYLIREAIGRIETTINKIR